MKYEKRQAWPSGFKMDAGSVNERLLVLYRMFSVCESIKVCEDFYFFCCVVGVWGVGWMNI